MKLLTCAAVRRRLGAWHDGELPPIEQCAVDQHLESCPPCRSDAKALARVGSLLREEAGRRALSPDAVAGLRAAVLGRARAEAAQSLPALLGEWFSDMHLVWAGLSATAATALCAVMLLGMAYFSPPERADSLAGILSALAEPGSDRNPVALGRFVEPPQVWSDDAVPAVFSSASEEDLVFALAAVVTQEGRISRSEVLGASQHDRQMVLQLMNAVSAARFRPARVGGEPVAVNMVWLVTHTTVRAKRHS